MDLSTEFDELISNDNADFNYYLTRIEKIYLADNLIVEMSFLCKLVNL